MSSKGQILNSLKWKSFKKYPPQGADVIIRFGSIGCNGQVTSRRYVSVHKFNAVTFDIKRLMKEEAGYEYFYGWIEEEVAEQALNESEDSDID